MLSVGSPGCGMESLSSWRAWIEILLQGHLTPSYIQSLSSWRAWIEILSMIYASDSRQVALLMESVD